MTDYKHINNANNLEVISSYEFSHITSYLISKIITPAKVLPIMQNACIFPSLTLKKKSSVEYYTVSQSDAWKYFSSMFPIPISNRKIRDMDDLLYSAENWVNQVENNRK